MIKILNTKSLYASLYEAVRFCKENTNYEINVIVPDKLELFMEKFLLEKINISASFKIKVSTLNRYAKRKLSIDNKNIISDIGCVLLINKILNKNIYKLETLKSHEYSFSYAENILRTLNQFKASRISYNELENFKSSNIQLANKIKDLAFIYKEFETLKAGLLDSSDLFLMSTTVIAEGLTSKNFLFVGFDDFTSIEYAIIEQLSMNNNVIFLTNYSKGNNKRIFNIEIYSQLQQIANITNQDFKVEFTADDYTDCKSFLQNNLFAVNNEKFVLKL